MRLWIFALIAAGTVISLAPSVAANQMVWDLCEEFGLSKGPISAPVFHACIEYGCVSFRTCDECVASLASLVPDSVEGRVKDAQDGPPQEDLPPAPTPPALPDLPPPFS